MFGIAEGRGVRCWDVLAEDIPGNMGALGDVGIVLILSCEIGISIWFDRTL